MARGTFHGSAYEAYAALADHCSSIRLAGGEAAHNFFMARHLIDYGRIGYVQIDCGRIGGLGPAKRVADYAQKRNVTFINHIFTSHLALSASLQPPIGLPNDRLCEYPVALSRLAWELSTNHILPDANGEIALPDAVGLGIGVNKAALKKYLVPTEILVKGQRLYQTPPWTDLTLCRARSEGYGKPIGIAILLIVIASDPEKAAAPAAKFAAA